MTPLPFDAMELSDFANRCRALAAASHTPAEVASLVALAAHATELMMPLVVEPRGEHVFGLSDVRGAYAAYSAATKLRRAASPGPVGRECPGVPPEPMMGPDPDNADQFVGGAGAPAAEIGHDEDPADQLGTPEAHKINWLARVVARRRGIGFGTARSAIVAALDGRRLIDLIESGKLTEFIKLVLSLLVLFV